MSLLQRRSFLAQIAAPALAGNTIRAVAFDALAIFDTTPISAGIQPTLATLWRARQFEYTWLRTLMNRYAGFDQITSDALRFAAQSLGIELPPTEHHRLIQAYFELRPWPDVPAALNALRQRGIRTAILSNFTGRMLQTNSARANLRFDALLSTDGVQAFKPDRRAYQMSVDTFGLPARQILYIPSAGWDAAGAKAFGHPVQWINRQKQPLEELHLPPDLVLPNLTALRVR